MRLSRRRAWVTSLQPGGTSEEFLLFWIPSSDVSDNSLQTASNNVLDKNYSCLLCKHGIQINVGKICTVLALVTIRIVSCCSNLWAKIFDRFPVCRFRELRHILYDNLKTRKVTMNSDGKESAYGELQIQELRFKFLSVQKLSSSIGFLAEFPRTPPSIDTPSS